MVFLVIAENIKRRASLIIDSAEHPLKEDSEDGGIFRIDDLDKHVATEVMDYNATEEKSPGRYKNPLERCVSAREMRMRRRSISEGGSQ